MDPKLYFLVKLCVLYFVTVLKLLEFSRSLIFYFLLTCYNHYFKFAEKFGTNSRYLMYSDILVFNLKKLLPRMTTKLLISFN